MFGSSDFTFLHARVLSMSAQDQIVSTITEYNSLYV